MGGNKHCSIPGCRTRRPKIKTETGNNVTLFSLPRSKEQLEKWNKAVQRVDKEFRFGDKVCSLHFTEDDIIRYYETKLPDGTVWRIERERTDLKSDAVPTIFPNLQNVGPCATNLTQQPVLQNSPRKRKSSSTINTTFIIPPLTLNTISTIISPKKAKRYVKILPKSEENKLNANPDTAETIQNESLGQTGTALSEMPEIFTYSTLVKNLELIPKPNLLWGIAIHDEFVMCAKWNEDSTLMKRVIVDRNLKIQVFLQNRELDFDHIKISSIGHLSCILHEVDKFAVCINANNMKIAGCDGYILPKTRGNQCRYCQLIGNCEVNRNTIYWLSRGKNFSKYQTLYDRIQTLNNNNGLLKAQINKIMKIKAVWRLSNQTNQNPTTS